MRTIHHNGFTLVELLVCIAILGIIVTAVIPLLSTSFAANGRGISRAGLYREGMLAMERMTQGVRRSTYLEIPNAHKPQRDLLAFSGFVNDDNDYYFNDPLFPRIDEDPGDDMNADGGPGIKNYDDDGNGSVDEWGNTDDDEDGFLYLSGNNEDPLDGIDNDGDGNIDEDFGKDANNDGKPGIAGMDDNGNGIVDDGAGKEDDDEDGAKNEDPLNEVIYVFENATHTLWEVVPSSAEKVALSTRVTFFQAEYQAPERIRITLTLTDDDGKSITYAEYVCPRNVRQKTGKRVR
jgi:prepilin-type N-terminal cleavage/methylation domain-containing protein